MVRRTNLKDVAARAGVSYQTVSKVLNGVAHVSPDTLERVWAAARELGYRPHLHARNLRIQRSRMIGYSWTPTPPGQVNHVLDLFLTSMIAEAEAAGYHLLPFSYREGDEQISGYRELIDAGQIDGFVISSMNYGDSRVRFLQQRQVPFVAFGRAEGDFPYVDIDGAAGLRAATEHLLARGHERIAALAWPDDSRVGEDRLSGYLAALIDAGHTPDPQWIARGEGNFEFAYATVRRWLAAPERPTGLVALNDAMAIGALAAAQAEGLVVGRDLAIVGFDDVPMAQYLTPPLTSVRQPIRAAGRKCVELLVALLEGQTPRERQVLLAPQLIVRGSA